MIEYFSKINFSFLGLLFLIGILQPSYSQTKSDFPKMDSGPMIGYTGMREVQIWMQWKTPAQNLAQTSQGKFSLANQNVYLEFREKSSSLSPVSKPQDSSPKAKLETSTAMTEAYRRTPVYHPNPKTGVLNIPIELLEPGKIYEYKIFVNAQEIKFETPLEFKTKPLWQYRKDPPNVKLAIGSCNYINEEAYDRPGKIYGLGYEIFESIRLDQPEFFVWMGDNVYLREADWDSESGILHRYSHTRQNKEMQSMLASMFHIAIWDDHDFGPNDASSSFGLNKVVERIFKEFWPDPSYPSKGIYRTYSWSDIDFFLLDNRTFRTANNNYYSKDRSALGKIQKEWLFNALSDSKASVKFIVLGGQFINSAKVYENLSNYEKDREEILDFIQRMKISGVVFLSGDRHHSEMSRLERGNLYPIYEWTISPLTAGISTTTQSEPNVHRVKDSFILDRVYGLIELEGVGKDRKIQFTTKNSKGVKLFQMEIPISSLTKVE